MDKLSDSFSDPNSVATYADRPPKLVPGYYAMQRMAAILLAERVPARGRVLVLGAGGGLELSTFAQAHPEWTFDGVDPAPEMLRLAETTLGPLMSRVRLHEGYIDDAPPGPFDGAASLLTLQFLDPDERRRTAAQVRRRLRPGAPFVVAHFSFPYSNDDDRALWLSRYAAFGTASGIDAATMADAHAAIDARLHILTPDEDEQVLRDAGFADVTPFYTAFTFRGWVGYATD
ncbi:class I SAM-dependent methyltransferase [Mycolicibacterium sp. XJ870]